MKILSFLLTVLLGLSPILEAEATIIPSVPYTLTNGSTADATQVMSDFNTIITDVNANAAASGANADITSLTGLTTPIALGSGGSAVFVSGLAGGTANALACVTNPNPFSYLNGTLLTCQAHYNNTGATTINTGDGNPITVKKIAGGGGLTDLVSGDLTTNNSFIYEYDGTELVLLNPTPAAAAASKITPYLVSDTTDITLSQAPTQQNVGSSQSITIPTKGRIEMVFSGQVNNTAAANSMILGMRIGGVNYWPTVTQAGGGQTTYEAAVWDNDTNNIIVANTYGVGTGGGSGTLSTPSGAFLVGFNIEALSLPTGAQTVQIIAGKGSNSGVMVLKGATTTTRIYITVYDHS